MPSFSIQLVTDPKLGSKNFFSCNKIWFCVRSFTLYCHDRNGYKSHSIFIFIFIFFIFKMSKYPTLTSQHICVGCQCVCAWWFSLWKCENSMFNVRMTNDELRTANGKSRMAYDDGWRLYWSVQRTNVHKKWREPRKWVKSILNSMKALASKC